MNIITNAVGGPINALILASLAADILVAIALFLCVSGGHNLWKKRKAKLQEEAAREAEALIGADATPSLMYPKGDDESSISGMFRIFCMNGGVADVVEDICRDLKCEHPCPQHPECQLAQ